MDENSDGIEYPDEAGYPDGAGFLSENQQALVEEVQAPQPSQAGIDFFVVDNEAERTYEAISGDTLIGGITYERSDDAITLIATSVFPEFRHQGVSSELIRRVLDLLRTDGRRVIVSCPVVRAFVRHHPEYRELMG
ncbi:GNAT family N-acetyltransferase [Leifsonia sp. LS-T14]|uniref:GNAT family N-acetyltransferase n=1 Tax=unclassified Leifsonia TaxID=2663824 RepID=UPI0035A61700